MAGHKTQYLTDDTIVFPALIAKLEIDQSSEAARNEMLLKIKEGRIYKAYDHESGIIIFPDKDDSNGFVFEDYVISNEFYSVEIVQLTEDNIHEHIEEINDDDVDLIDELINKSTNDERQEKLTEERVEAITYEKIKKRMAEKYAVSDKQIITAFSALREKDPVMAKALLEIIFYCLSMLNQRSVIDSTMIGIMMDKDLGKGAFVTNAMNSLIQYSKTGDRKGVNNVLNLTFFSIMEATRNIE